MDELLDKILEELRLSWKISQRNFEEIFKISEIIFGEISEVIFEHT